tara:strand:- start:2766 stop:3629 length:864 start_codon:yes stop_codon:yes gene_type:complete
MTEKTIVDLVRESHKDSTSTSPQEGSKRPGGASLQGQAERMSENIPVDKGVEEALEKLLQNVRNKMAWSEVKLPSQGLLYPNNETSIRIRPFTFEDERLLKSQASQDNPETILESLLRNCTEGIDVTTLTPHDKVYVLFCLRGISYGDNYPISHDCVNCKVTSNLDMSIKSLETTPLKREDMVFTLPDSLMEAEIKLPRGQDEHLWNTPESLMANMHMFVYRVGEIMDKTIIEAFIHKTTVRDIDTLRTRIFTPEYGMENHFFYNCKGCNHKNKVDIALNESFFTAS